MANARSPAASGSHAASAAALFRAQIEAAEAEGVTRDDMTLRLTLGDVHKLKRDPGIALSDISFAGGVMRYLGVKIEPGGVAASALDRGDA
jgi:hypothetical protein